MKEKCGDTLEVESMPEGRHEYKNPIEEVADMKGAENVFVFNPDEVAEGDEDLS